MRYDHSKHAGCGMGAADLGVEKGCPVTLLLVDETEYEPTKPAPAHQWEMGDDLGGKGKTGCDRALGREKGKFRPTIAGREWQSGTVGVETMGLF